MPSIPVREEAFLGLWKPGWKRPVLAPFLASSRVPLPLCPVDILWDVSVYFGYRKHTVQATAATLFLDRPRMTFELCCSQSSSIYQMGETLRQLENAHVPFFGSATACVSLRPVGEKAKHHTAMLSTQWKGIDIPQEKAGNERDWVYFQPPPKP